MADPKDIFESDYVAGSSSTSILPDTPRRADERANLQANTVGTSNEQVIVEQNRYGSGKPRRIVLRGKISSD